MTNRCGLGRLLQISVLLGAMCLCASLFAQNGSQGSSQGSKNEPAQQSSPQDQSQRPKRVRVSQGVAEGLVVKKVPPTYPQEAHDHRIQGVVLVQILIGETGDVVDARLISGYPALAQAAIDAVKQWTYKPYLLNGEPVEVETKVQVNFTLSG